MGPEGEGLMGIFQPQIDEVLFNIRCDKHTGIKDAFCFQCIAYPKVKDLVATLDAAQETTLMSSVLRGSALQLLQVWMSHAKGCKAKPEEDCKYCVNLALAAQSAMKKVESLAAEKEYLDRIKAIEDAAAKIEKLGPDLMKSTIANEKKRKDLTLLVQRYYMIHSLAQADSMCGCDICKEAAPFIDPSTIT